MTLLIEKDILSEEDSRFYIAETIMAVKSVHDMNYIHRDLKPSNILLTKKKDVKLCDFGTSKKIALINPSTFTGTLLYMAPEIIKLENENEKKVKWRVWIIF